MADTKQCQPENPTNFKEAVCISAARVYDSCCDRDCLEDLICYFNAETQQLVSTAQTVRLRSAEVVYTNIDVEPVNFHRGYYACTLNFYFLVTLDINCTSVTAATTVTGLACYRKQVVLFGSEGTVKSFSNVYTPECGTGTETTLADNAPRCTVDVVEPVSLSSRLCTPTVIPNCVNCVFPQNVLDLVGGSVVAPEANIQTVFVSLGLFTIVQLIRTVQLLVPVYDFAFPEKRCIDTADSPCEVFRAIDFPTSDFFPPRPCNLPNNCEI